MGEKFLMDAHSIDGVDIDDRLGRRRTNIHDNNRKKLTKIEAFKAGG